MASRPELLAPPDIFYNNMEARKYTSSSRIFDIQAQLSERALELLYLPEDGVPRLLLDIGLSGETLSENAHQWIGLDISESMLSMCCFGARSGVEGDLLIDDMGQWLCNADKSSHESRLRQKAFFGSLYRCLARGARAVFQVYPESVAQCELISSSAMRAGFSGGVVVDNPHSTKEKKEDLVLTCGPPAVSTSVPSGKVGDRESCSDDEISGDEENQTVSNSDRHRPRKKLKTTKKGKGKGQAWVFKKKSR